MSKKGPPKGIYRNAITEADGVSVNVGYLSLFWLLGHDILMSVVLVGAGFVAQRYHPTHAYPLQEVGIALGAVWGTFSTALGALGVFLVGDRKAVP